MSAPRPDGRPSVNFEVLVESDDGVSTLRHLSGVGPFVIGRQEQCDIRLPDDLVSRQHAVVFAHRGGLRVRDTSSNGTVAGDVLLHGQEIDVALGTPIVVGGHRMVIRSAADELHIPAESAEAEKSPSAAPQEERRSTPDGPLRREIHQRLLDFLDLAKLETQKLDEPSLRPRVLAGLRTIIESMRARLPQGTDEGRPEAAEAAYARALARAPGDDQARSNLLMSRHYRADVAPADHLDAALRAGAALEDAALVRRDFPNDPTPGRRLRIGYVSADFRRHPSAISCPRRSRRMTPARWKILLRQRRAATR